MVWELIREEGPMSKKGKAKKGKGKQGKTGQKGKAKASEKTVTAKAKTRSKKLIKQAKKRSKKLLRQAEEQARKVAPKVRDLVPSHVVKKGPSRIDPDRAHSDGAAASTLKDPIVRP